MPHGLTVDDEFNIWVTDVALHQVNSTVHYLKYKLSICQLRKLHKGEINYININVLKLGLKFSVSFMLSVDFVNIVGSFKKEVK